MGCGDKPHPSFPEDSPALVLPTNNNAGKKRGPSTSLQCNLQTVQIFKHLRNRIKSYFFQFAINKSKTTSEARANNKEYDVKEKFSTYFPTNKFIKTINVNIATACQKFIRFRTPKLMNKISRSDIKKKNNVKFSTKSNSLLSNWQINSYRHCGDHPEACWP